MASLIRELAYSLIDLGELYTGAADLTCASLRPTNARNRHEWNGQRLQCSIPSEAGRPNKIGLP